MPANCLFLAAMEEQQVYIHIGMPRSASTFLQNQVFGNLKGFDFKGLDESYYSKSFNQLQFSDDSFYQEKLVLDLVKTWDAEKLIISNENFIGQSIYFNHSNRSAIAKRLQNIYPKASIVLVLRNQIDLLASMYAINLQGNEVGTIDDFIWTPKDVNLDKGWGQGDSHFNTTMGYECLDGYDYSSLIRLYQGLFMDVHVLLFEEMIDSPERFSVKLGQAINASPDEISTLLETGSSMNHSVTEKQAKKLIRLNKYQDVFDQTSIAGRGVQYMKRKVIKKSTKGEKPMFSEAKRKALTEHFSPLNKQLAKNFPDLNLEKYASEYYL